MRLGVDDVTTARLDGLRALTRRPGLGGPDLALRLANLGVAELGVDALDAGIGHLRAALATSPVDDSRRPYYLMSCGGALVQRFARSRQPADLAAGTDMLESCQLLAASSTHPYWAATAQALAHAYRLGGRHRLGRETGLRGLRGNAWNALLQPDPPTALAAARQAAADAVDVARWCLADDEPADAVFALEAGRGVLIHAATQPRGVAERLTVRGHHDLADRWARESASGGPEQVRIELRRRVLAALTGIAVESQDALALRPPAGWARLLEPPSTHEIRAALRALGLDAMAYLVPGDRCVPGAAVLVPVDRHPGWLPLPELTAGSGMDLDRHRSALDALCDWSWRVGVGPLLDAVDRPDRPPRLALVPIGELGRVPWHAARGPGGYAIERAAFTYAASARLLCESAWRDDARPTSSGLVLADPDASGAGPALPAAGDAARAIVREFYPTARHLGRSGSDGPGAAAEVLAWLADSARPPGGLVHLACHGALRCAGETGDTSHLVLAGGERLGAEQLFAALMARPQAAPALAVLAAGTGVPDRGYDEAFSLATALLAGGAGGVLAAGWPISDEAASVLSFLLHHYLRQGLGALDALRQAQLWRLDPARRMPEGMPRRLAASAGRDNPVPVADWAAFVHFGR